MVCKDGDPFRLRKKMTVIFKVGFLVTFGLCGTFGCYGGVWCAYLTGIVRQSAFFIQRCDELPSCLFIWRYTLGYGK
jgi:hypothetical protein